MESLRDRANENLSLGDHDYDEEMRLKVDGTTASRKVLERAFSSACMRCPGSVHDFIGFSKAPVACGSLSVCPVMDCHEGEGCPLPCVLRFLG